MAHFVYDGAGEHGYDLRRLAMTSIDGVIFQIMLNYFKRDGDEGTNSSPKRQRTAGSTSAIGSSPAFSKEGDASGLSPRGTGTAMGPDWVGADPVTIVTWNANGLGVRLGKDWRDFKDFMTTVMPDVCCIQEVRYAAAGLPKCKKDDNRGRIRGQMKADTTADRKDRELLQGTLRALAHRLGYRLVMSLANYKYAGTAVLIRKTCPPTEVFYSLSSEGLSKEHHQEGRTIALEFRSFTLLILYVPNNGVKEESFQRREDWDANLRAFVDKYDKPLIVSGDLNVAHEDADLTHPGYFKRMCPASDARNSGQPGCTPAERERHTQLLQCGGGLVDTYRLLHPARPHAGGFTGDAGDTHTPGITWRGTAGNDVAEAGRFYGKGMRIDYFLVSRSLAGLVKEVKVFGSGPDREEFLGSDHSPVLLRLQDAKDVAQEGAASNVGGSGGGGAESDKSQVELREGARDDERPR